MPKLERDKLSDIEIHVGDPNEQVRDSLRSIMRAEGARRISTFIRPEEFLENLKKSSPDLLLLADDFDDNIFDIVRDIRHYRLGNNPFVLITMLISQDNEGGMKKVIQCGADDVLIKPLTPGRLLERIAHLAYNRLPFIATTDYVGPERRRANDRPSAIPRLDVVNTMKEKVEGRRLSTVQLTRSVNECMLAVLNAQLDSYPLKLAYACNLIIKAWTDKDLLADRRRQFELVEAVLEDAAYHARRLRRENLADAWLSMKLRVEQIRETFKEGKPDLAGLQMLPKDFDAARALHPEVSERTSQDGAVL